jgi:hypothetical protein
MEFDFKDIKPQLLLKHRLVQPLKAIKAFGKDKVFCIGFNKTGTTSLKSAMHDFGYLIGSEYHAKFLFNDWLQRDWKPIIKYCRHAQFFQDSPFSLPHTFIPLDHAFPGSKFILTIRDDEEQWYNSLVKFHSKLWGNGNNPPTVDDLKNATTNAYKGRPYHTILNIFDVNEDNPYQKDILINSYLTHIEQVKAYFRHREDDLIIINVSKKEDYLKLCDFLGQKPIGHDFPWKNKT